MTEKIEKVIQEEFIQETTFTSPEDRKINDEELLEIHKIILTDEDEHLCQQCGSFYCPSTLKDTGHDYHWIHSFCSQLCYFKCPGPPSFDDKWAFLAKKRKYEKQKKLNFSNSCSNLQKGFEEIKFKKEEGEAIVPFDAITDRDPVEEGAALLRVKYFTGENEDFWIKKDKPVFVDAQKASLVFYEFFCGIKTMIPTNNIKNYCLVMYEEEEK